MIKQENLEEVFKFYPGKAPFKGILSIPHSGEEIPHEFTKYLSENNWDLMQDVDYRVHELIDIEKLQDNGISIIKANIIRTSIDLNRAKDDSLLNWKKNSKGKQIVLSEPDDKEKTRLIEKYYSPYYEMLKTLIFELQTQMNIPSLVDLHSMPAQAEEYHLKINPNQDKVRPDFCVSDISGISCETEFIDFIQNDLSQNFEKVTKNNPYFGGNITRFLHKTYTPLNNIQIEISRGIYMNEDTKDLNSDKVAKLRKYLTDALINLFEEFYSIHKN